MDEKRKLRTVSCSCLADRRTPEQREAIVERCLLVLALALLVAIAVICASVAGWLPH